MRALIRRTPVALRVIDPITEEFERLAEYLWDSWDHPFFSTGFPALIDMHQDDKDLVVKTELPGMDQKGIGISLKDNVLTVIAEKRDDDEAGEHREFRRYQRSVTIPRDVDAEDVSATYQNGLLEIRFPKVPESESKQIEVKVPEKPEAKAKIAKPKGKRKAAKKTKKATN